MKLLRRLKPLELTIPLASKKNRQGEIIREPLPLTPALKFLAECNAIEDGARGEQGKVKRLKYFLIEQHQAIFGTAPNEGLALRVIKARCCYRLQAEGYRCAGMEPGSRFKTNYKAVMQFDDNDPFKGCEPETAWIAKRLTLNEGKVITMSNLVKATTVIKKKIKAATQSKPAKGTGKDRELIFGKYPPTQVIRWYAKAGAAVEQIAEALEKLKVHIARGTIHIQSGKGRKGENIPSVSNEDRDALKKVLPDAKPVTPKTTLSKGKASPPKSVKKIKKLEKVTLDEVPEKPKKILKKIVKK